MNDLLSQIREVSDYTDQRKFAELEKKVDIERQTHPDNKLLIYEAKQKDLI